MSSVYIFFRACPSLSEHVFVDRLTDLFLGNIIVADSRNNRIQVNNNMLLQMHVSPSGGTIVIFYMNTIKKEGFK